MPIVTGLVLAFAHTLGESGVVLTVGGSIPGETHTVAVAIYDRMQAFDASVAELMLALLLLMSLAALGVIYGLSSRVALVALKRPYTLVVRAILILLFGGMALPGAGSARDNVNGRKPIGFPGAGMILCEGINVHGLITAATPRRNRRAVRHARSRRC